jgi:hypothetical protein
VHTKTLPLLLIFAVLFSFNGCAYMSASGRREMAYRHYVRKNVRHHQRDIARAQKSANRTLMAKMKSAVRSEPQITTSVESSPGSWSEPMAPPESAPAQP